MVLDEDDSGAIDLLRHTSLSATDQLLYLQHAQRSLRGLDVISWTQQRLGHFLSVLEATLDDPEDNQLASTRNIIVNYEALLQSFAEQEKRKLRIGQFRYVVRTVFAGASSHEEILERMVAHRTFGEVQYTREQLEGGMQRGREARERAIAASEAVRVRKAALDTSLEDAVEDAKREKARNWLSRGGGQHKDYVFQNYRFEESTPRVEGGSNVIRGLRSSWEAIVEALVDHLNARLKTRLLIQTNLTDQQRIDEMRRVRFDLAYEPVHFPVGIERTPDGGERVVVYILDFIELNRLIPIEVKGALTSRARWKISRFEKLYIDDDFSDVPPADRPLLRMYVEQARDEVRRLQRRAGYLPRDEMQRLRVIGGWEWDNELMQFRVPTSEWSGKWATGGTIRRIENAVRRGKIPDIRPEKYVASSDLPSILRDERKAQTNVRRMEIVAPAAVKQFDAAAIAKASERAATHDGLCRAVRAATLETLPLTASQRLVISRLLSVSDYIEQIELQLGDQYRFQRENHTDDFETADLVESTIVLNLPFQSSVFLAECDRLIDTIETYCKAHPGVGNVDDFLSFLETVDSFFEDPEDDLKIGIPGECVYLIPYAGKYRRSLDQAPLHVGLLRAMIQEKLGQYSSLFSQRVERVFFHDSLTTSSSDEAPLRRRARLMREGRIVTGSHIAHYCSVAARFVIAKMPSIPPEYRGLLELHLFLRIGYFVSMMPVGQPRTLIALAAIRRRRPGIIKKVAEVSRLRPGRVREVLATISSQLPIDPICAWKLREAANDDETLSVIDIVLADALGPAYNAYFELTDEILCTDITKELFDKFVDILDPAVQRSAQP